MVLIPPVHSLSCLTCLHTHGTNQLDNFRVSTRLARPLCPMEPIKCDRDQDVCVTITMHMGNGEYWMGAGCDRRANFQHLNCQNTKTVSRTVQMGYAHERRAMQRVCVCNNNLCNSTRPDSSLFSLLAPLILLATFILR